MKHLLLPATLGVSTLLATPARAQYNQLVTRSTPTTTNVYAWERIELLPGCVFAPATSAASDRVEAVIKPLEAVGGYWSAPQVWTTQQPDLMMVPPRSHTGLVAIHLHVLPNGTVLSWEGHNDDNLTQESHVYGWQFGSATTPYPYYQYDNMVSNLFCAGHTFLPDGRLLVAGGHYSTGAVDRGIDPATGQSPDPNLFINDPNNPDYIPPGYNLTGTNGVNNFVGLRTVSFFNHLGKDQTQASNTSPNYAWQTPGNYSSTGSTGTFFMKYRRWYPTATTLADGRVLVTAGQKYGGYGTGATATPQQADNPELFTPGATPYGTWQELGSATRRLPWYPWMFQAPDGRVFNAGPNFRTGWLNPTGATIGDTPAGQWSNGPLPLRKWDDTNPNQVSGIPYDANTRMWGSAVMYQPGKILVLGGYRNRPDEPQPPITNSTERIDLTQANPQWPNPSWQASASMRYPRFHANATLLADGSVLVSGGGNRLPLTPDDASDDTGVLPAELWTPNSSVAGGSWQQMAALDIPRLYHSTAVLLPDATVLTAGGGLGGGYHEHPDYQIFTPPYLCQPGATRPSISYAPPAVAYGQSFRVQTPQAGAIVRATWVRLSSVTHSFNMNQRFLDVPFTYPASSGNELVLTAPANPNECPPGHYMLFLLNKQGVPSVASIQQVSASSCTASLELTATQTRTDPCTGLIHFAVTAATSSGNLADYQWTLNGQPTGVPAGQTYFDYEATPTSPTANVQVTATRNCAGPPVAAGQQVTMYFRGCSSGQPCAECRPATPGR